MATEPITPQDLHALKITPGLQLVLSVTAAVVGAVLPQLFGDATPANRLTGMVVAAVVPLVITWVGPWQHLRAGAGVGLAVVAIAVTYAGGTAVNGETFPAPDAIVQDPPTGDSDGGTGGGSTGGGDATPRLEASTDTVNCEPDGLCEPLQITARGGAVELGDAQLTGDDAGQFTPDATSDCHGRLERDESCAFVLGFAADSDDGAARAATLEVPHDGADAPLRIDVAGTAPGPSELVDVTLGYNAEQGCAFDGTMLTVPYTLDLQGVTPDEIDVTASFGDITGTVDESARVASFDVPAEVTPTELVLSATTASDEPSDELRVAVDLGDADVPVRCTA